MESIYCREEFCILAETTFRKILFLVVNEDPGLGLVSSQLTDPVRSALKVPYQIYHISLPNLSKRHADIHRSYTGLPLRYFLFSNLIFLYVIYCFFQALFISVYIRRKKFSAVYCRGYVSGLIGAIINRLFNTPYVFDPRSMFVQENKGAGKIKNKRIESVWLRIERFIVEGAHRVVSVSRSQSKYYENNYKMRDSVIIPCFSAPARPIKEKQASELKRELGFAESDVIVGYFGSLDYKWNNINHYISLFDVIREKGAKVLILSQNHDLINKHIESHPNVRVLVTNGVSIDELRQTLQICDYGLVSMMPLPDWESRLSVKFVEYLGAGLTVLVGKYVGEAVWYANNVFQSQCKVFENKNALETFDFSNTSKHSVDKVENIFGYSNILKAVADK
jgi:hypothetical protein